MFQSCLSVCLSVNLSVLGGAPRVTTTHDDMKLPSPATRTCSNLFISDPPPPYLLANGLLAFLFCVQYRVNTWILLHMVL